MMTINNHACVVDVAYIGRIKMSEIEGKIVNTNKRRFVIQYNQGDLDNIAPDKQKDWGTYIEIKDEKQRLKRRILKGTTPYIIYGVKGTGKTLMIHNLAKELGYALVEIACGDNIKERHLFGSPQIDLNGSYWNAGKVAVAYEGLKIYKKVILFFDDLTNLPPEIQLQLLSLFDKRKYIDIAGQRLEVGEGQHLMIIATGNPSSYAGVNSLTPALLSRCIGEGRDNPSSEDISKIIDWTDIPVEEVKEPLLTIVANSHDMVMKSNVDYELSPRDVDQFVNIYRDNIADGMLPVNNLRECIHSSILIKYKSEPSEYESMRIRCEETFGISV